MTTTIQNPIQDSINTKRPSFSNKRLACYDLVQYSQELQQAIKEGYELCFDTENCPVMIGTLFTCGLVKQQDVGLVKQPTKPDVSDVKPANTKGRKPAVQS